MKDKTENKLMEEIKQLEKQKGLSIVNVTALITKKERLKQHRETRKEAREKDKKIMKLTTQLSQYVSPELLEKKEKEFQEKVEKFFSELLCGCGIEFEWNDQEAQCGDDFWYEPEKTAKVILCPECLEKIKVFKEIFNFEPEETGEEK